MGNRPDRPPTPSEAYALLGRALPTFADERMLDAPTATLAAASSEARYRTLVQNLPNTIIALYDRDLRGISIDGPMLPAGGIDPADFRGRPLSDTVPPERYSEIEPHYLAALEGRPGSMEYTTEEGRTFHLEILPAERSPSLTTSASARRPSARASSGPGSSLRSPRSASRRSRDSASAS